ncbi:MAG: hypothetical protein ABFD16_02585, partial [Thermoguttaceae bacterium]
GLPLVQIEQHATNHEKLENADCYDLPPKRTLEEHVACSSHDWCAVGPWVFCENEGVKRGWAEVADRTLAGLL